VRPQENFEIPNAWVLPFVNPKWSYNKDDWKTYKLDWSQITDADSWRVEIKKDLETDMSKWNDKIWLLNWFRKHNISGPEVVWSKYSSSTWHSQQPLRWGDPKFGTSAEMNAQNEYIAGRFTGMDWAGISDLDRNHDAKMKKLKEAPSDLMRQLQQFCTKGIEGTNPGDFVIKASHLSESQGVFVVKNGNLIKDVRSDFIANIEFPVKTHGAYSEDPIAMANEIDQMEKQDELVPVNAIFTAFPEVARLFAMFPKGAKVCGDDERLANVQLVMEFQEMIWVRWESARSKIIPRGTLIEKIRRSDLEIKVSVGLGRAWGYYYNSVVDSLDRLTEDAKNEAYRLAEAAAVAAGVDFCRADIIVGEKGLIISELTLVPGLNWWTKKPLDGHIAKLVAWHKYDQEHQA